MSSYENKEKDEDERSEISENNDIPFWSENPNALLDTAHITELFPIGDMTYNQKLNSITRIVLLFGIVGFFITRGWVRLRIVIITSITIATIYAFYYYHLKEEREKDEHRRKEKEGFGSPASVLRGNTTVSFDTPTATNPFSNVLLTDYEFNTNKPPAPPCNNDSTTEIINQAKQMIQNNNPPDITDKLFRSLGDEYLFEQSLRPFHSTASTTIPNDQGAFADFCYGGMVSCKEGNQFACARNLSRHTNL